VIEVETGLLPRSQPHEKSQLVQDDFHLLGDLPGEEGGASLQSLAEARRQVAALVDAARVDGVLQGGHDVVPYAVHAEGRDLHRQAGA